MMQRVSYQIYEVVYQRNVKSALKAVRSSISDYIARRSAEQHRISS